jgi:hypothetical protein
MLMTDITADSPSVAFVDDPHAPEVFATSAAGFFHFQGNVTITFESPRVDHSTTPGPVNRVVMARLVMPVAGAQNLVAALNGFLEQQGLSPSDAIAAGSTRQ